MINEGLAVTPAADGERCIDERHNTFVKLNLSRQLHALAIALAAR